MDEILCRIYGEYYNYKPCCIDNFINSHHSDRTYVNRTHSYFGTGFIPCNKCCDEIKDYTFDEFKIWLGRNDIDNESKSIKDEYVKAIIEVNSDKFNELCKKYNYDKTEYLEFLQEQINKFGDDKIENN